MWSTCTHIAIGRMQVYVTCYKVSPVANYSNTSKERRLCEVAGLLSLVGGCPYLKGIMMVRKVSMTEKAVQTRMN